MSNTKRIFLSPPHMGGEELKHITEAFEINYIAPGGPIVESFEREWSKMTGIPYSLAVSTGTSAMHLALREVGVGPGDEIIASTLTFIGSVSPVVFLGATPVFIDSDYTTWNIDPVLLEEELKFCHRRGRLPKAVVVTDLYGQCADMDNINQICAHYNIPVISDSAEAVGSTYKGKHAGAGAKVAVYSFNGNKIITTSGGGMLSSTDESLIKHARYLANQAREPVPHYEHREIGYNYRMSSILAAIGLGQLKILPQRVNQKRKIFETYYSLLCHLPGIEFMPEASYGKSNRWLTVILIDPSKFGTDREHVRCALEAENIESRPVWKPMHLQPVFKGCRVRGGKVGEDLFARGLCLPSGTALTQSDIERIASIISKCIR